MQQNAKKLKIVSWQEQYAQEARALLNRYQETSLFLLNNLQSCGPSLTDNIYSGNYKLLMLQDKVVAVFVLTRFGNVLMQTDRKHDYAKMILQVCLEENLPLRGVVAELGLVENFYQKLKKQLPNLKPQSLSKEILYNLDLQTVAVPRLEEDLLMSLRLIANDEFALWDIREVALASELQMPLPDLLQRKQRFLEQVQAKHLWGAFIADKLVATAAYNAHVDDIAQIGKVYTEPGLRKRGIATKLMTKLISDSINIHHLSKLVLFTNTTNISAQTVYERVGFVRIGEFGLYFWENVGLVT